MSLKGCAGSGPKHRNTEKAVANPVKQGDGVGDEFVKPVGDVLGDNMSSQSNTMRGDAFGVSNRQRTG